MPPKILALPLVLLTGCIPTGSDEQPDDTRSGFHDVTVNWHLRNVDGSVMSACPPGFTTLVTHLYRAGYVEPPDALVKAPCTPEGSQTHKVATAGELIDEATRDDFLHAYYDYTPQKDIWMDVTEETQSAYAAFSNTYYVEALTSDRDITFDIYPAGGIGAVAWTLASSLTTAPLSSCQTAGVDHVEAAARPYADDTAPLVTIGTWPCDAVDDDIYYEPDGNGFPLLDEEYELGSGHTSGLAEGSYFVELRAKRSGAVVGRAEASLQVETQNSVHTIRPASITIDDR